MLYVSNGSETHEMGTMELEPTGRTMDASPSRRENRVLCTHTHKNVKLFTILLVKQKKMMQPGKFFWTSIGQSDTVFTLTL